MALNPDDISVESFSTAAAASVGGGLCCTGCDSGCGIFPTECYCESQSDDFMCNGGVIVDAQG